jgi:hypothetical protein
VVGSTLYPAQEEGILELFEDRNVRLKYSDRLRRLAGGYLRGE